MQTLQTATQISRPNPFSPGSLCIMVSHFISKGAAHADIPQYPSWRSHRTPFHLHLSSSFRFREQVQYVLSDEGLAAVRSRSKRSTKAAPFRNSSSIIRPISSVLFLEGEELQGAKQNRVLNTFVGTGCSKSKIKIPVSCVEQGRWRDTSRSSNRAAVTAPPNSGTFSRVPHTIPSKKAGGIIRTRAKSGMKSLGRWIHLARTR